MFKYKDKPIVLDSEALKIVDDVITENSSKRHVLRARVLLLLHQGLSVNAIVDKIAISKPLVYRLIRKYLKGGVLYALHDLSRQGRPHVFLEDEKAYVRQIACQIPYNVSPSLDLNEWTAESLALYIKENCAKKGLHNLKKINAKEVLEIVNKTELKLYIKDDLKKNKYKSSIVNILYKRLEFFVTIKNDLYKNKNCITIGYDDSSHLNIVNENKAYKDGNSSYKPSISNTILSLMIGVNLNTLDMVVERSYSHTNDDFIKFLDKLYSVYKDQGSIKIILDKHKFHCSEKTYTHIVENKLDIKMDFNPTDTYWINLFDTLFSKLMRVRLNSLIASDYIDLDNKLLSIISEINHCKVVKRWDDKIPLSLLKI